MIVSEFTMYMNSARITLPTSLQINLVVDVSQYTPLVPFQLYFMALPHVNKTIGFATHW